MPIGNSASDAARSLGRRPAAGVRPRRGDALHGGSRRDRDRVGRRAATRGSGGASRSRTTARPPPNRRHHPGRFSPDGRVLALGLKQRGIALWDAATLSPAGRALRETGGEVQDIAFAPDGRTLAAVTVEGLATVWDVEPPIAAAWTVPGCRGLASASASALTARRWPRRARRRAAVGPPHRRRRGLRRRRPRRSGDVAFSPDGASGRPRPRESAGHSRDLGGRRALADRDAAAALLVSRRLRAGVQPRRPDCWPAAASSPTCISWDVRTGGCSASSSRAAPACSALDFSPDGRILAVGGGEPVASLWDVATGTQIGPTLTAGEREDADRPVARRAPPAGHPRRRPRSRLECRPGLVGDARLRRRQSHADAQGVGGVPAGQAVRPGLRELSRLRSPPTR